MTVITGDEQYAIEMAIREWLLVDGTMDNHIQSAIEGSLDDNDEDDEEDGDEEGDWDPDRFADGLNVDELDEDELVELPAVAQLGKSIRQAGWDQIPGWPADGAAFRTWPSPGQTTFITLDGAQWDLVIAALLYWAEVDDDMDEEHSAEDAARSRAIAAAIQHKLSEQGWSAARSTGDRGR